MKIIDGRKLSLEILENIKHEVAGLLFVPVFCDVLVGKDPASLQYVGMKSKKAESVGIKFHSANFPESITTPELISEIISASVAVSGNFLTVACAPIPSANFCFRAM